MSGVLDQGPIAGPAVDGMAVAAVKATVTAYPRPPLEVLCMCRVAGHSAPAPSPCLSKRGSICAVTDARPALTAVKLRPRPQRRPVARARTLRQDSLPSLPPLYPKPPRPLSRCCLSFTPHLRHAILYPFLPLTPHASGVPLPKLSASARLRRAPMRVLRALGSTITIRHLHATKSLERMRDRYFIW